MKRKTKATWQRNSAHAPACCPVTLINQCHGIRRKLSIANLKFVSINCLFLLISSSIGCQKNDVTSKREDATTGQRASSAASSDNNALRLDSKAEAQTASNGDAQEASVTTQATISFRTATDTGIDFKRQDDMRGQNRIFESTGGGVGVIDFDHDGEADLVFTGGCLVPEQLSSTEPTCAIYRNKGNVKFQQVTVASRMIKPGYCQGVAVGDYDNDGFDDLYITALGSNALFHNQGDGTFVELTAQLAVDDSRWSTSCAFADVNLDGALDLYVVNYLDDSPTNPLLCRNEKSPTGFEQCPPAKYNGVNDRLFLGDGSGGFIDATDSSGLAAFAGKGLGVVVCDFDKVGLPEIYVSNDGQANYLFQLSVDSQGILKVNEIAMTSGAALSAAGYAQASMGIAAGDYDRDGLIDLHITNFYGDYNTVYKNQGELRFDDVTRLTGMAGPSKKFLGWGTVFADFDADGWLDLFVANGHVEDRSWNGRGEPFRMQPQLFRNTRDGRFADVSLAAGVYFNQSWLGRGVATVDLNHDNAIDLVITHQLEAPVILLNNQPGHGVSLELVGTTSNRNARGVKMTIRKTDSGNDVGVLFDELVAGSSYQSAVEGRFYISKSTETEVVWPSGSMSVVGVGGSGRVVVVEKMVDPKANLRR